MLLCVVTDGRHEASLSCAVSLLKLQTALMTAQERIHADMHFVRSFDDALGTLHRHPDAVGALVLNTSFGFDGEFALRAMRTGLPVVVASYPLPRVDWDRVTACAKSKSTEPVQFWGNKYNVEVVGPVRDGYAKAQASGLGVVWIRKEVVTSIAKRHPNLVDSEGTPTLALPGVVNGKRVDAYQRFLELYDGEVYADLDHPALNTGPLEYGGCVGARSVLR